MLVISTRKLIWPSQLTCKLGISANILLRNITQEYSFSGSEAAAVFPEKFLLFPPRIVPLCGCFGRVWCVKWLTVLLI